MAATLYHEDIGSLSLAVSDLLVKRYGDLLKPHGTDLEADEHFVPLADLLYDQLDRFSDGYQNYN